jgi:hypothetical protein
MTHPIYDATRYIKHVYDIKLCMTYGALASDRTPSEVQVPFCL